MTHSTTTSQTPSTQAKATPPPSSGVEGRRPGQEVDEQGPSKAARPSALAVHDRITWAMPFTVEQDVGDTDWTVTVGLTDDAARQLVRDLTRRHMADLILLSRLRRQQQDANRAGLLGTALECNTEAGRVEARLVGALQSMSTTRWTLTPGQAEELWDRLEDAQADPAECAVPSCSAYAIDGGSYCAPHDEAA